MKILVWFSFVWVCAACGSGVGNVTPDAMPNPMPIPSGFTFETADGSLTSVGWTGAFHDFKGAPDTSFAVKVTSCPNGVCQFEGPVDSMGPVNPAGTVNRRRCLQQTGKLCIMDSDCPLDENNNRTPCVFLYDPPISIRLGGKDSTGKSEVGACAFTYIPVNDTDGTAAIQGTLNLNSGELNLRKLTEKLVLNSTLNGTFQGVCPVCVGDASPNDGVRGGTCQTSPPPPEMGGQPDPGLPPDQGAKCDVNRYGDRPGYNYGYSMDCSPTPPPSVIKPADFSGSFSSSGFKLPLTEQSPKCTDSSFEDANCFCGICNNSPIMSSISCMSDANCSDGGVCVGASVPVTPPSPENVLVAGNLCDNGVCGWNEAESVGTCTSTRLGRIQVNCYPSAVMGTKGRDGKDVVITVPGRGTVQNNIYYADTASARCTPAGLSSTVNMQVGLPGLTFHKRNFRIIPAYTEAQK